MARAIEVDENDKIIRVMFTEPNLVRERLFYSDEGHIGDTYKDGVLTPREPIPLPVPMLDQVKKYYILLSQSALDKTAQERQYDNIASLCSYVNDINPKFKAEAEAGLVYRSAMWTYYSSVFDGITDITNLPKMQDFIKNMPTIVWPS